jgi:hypothetical protein
VRFTPEQERAIVALREHNGYIHPSGRMYTSTDTYFRFLGSKSFSGLIKKEAIKMVRRQAPDGETMDVWVLA